MAGVEVTSAASATRSKKRREHHGPCHYSCLVIQAWREWNLDSGGPYRSQAGAHGGPEQANFLSGVSDFRIGEIPAGDALLGGGLAVGIAELIDGFFPATTPNQIALMGLVAAFGVAQFGPQIIGQQASQFGAGFLAFDAIRRFVPIDTTIRNFVRQIRGTTTASLSQNDGGGGNRIETVKDAQSTGLPGLVAGRLTLAGL